jgi:flagella basal body P-ring formation protein FlgA
MVQQPHQHTSRTKKGGAGVLLCACFVLASLGALPGTVHGLEVQFKPQARVQGKRLHLRDVANIRPEGAQERYGSAVLFRVPDPGTVKTYKAGTLKAYVKNLVDADRPIRWSGAQRVTVRSEGSLIRGKRIERAIERYIRTRKPGFAEGDISFRMRGRESSFTLPAGSVDIQVNPSRKDVLKCRRFNLIFRVNGQVAKNTSVVGRIQARAPVVVAAKDLSRDRMVRRSDVKRKKIDVTGMDDPCTTPSKLVGKRLKHSMRAGEPFEAGDVARPLLVEHGEPVTLRARKGGLLVTARGIAQNDGAKGEMIRVENTSSGREVFARVTGDGRVKVEF